MPKQLFNLPEILTMRYRKQVTKYYLNLRNAAVAITWHVLWAELYLPHNCMWKSELSTLWNVTVFGYRAFKGVIG